MANRLDREVSIYQKWLGLDVIDKISSSYIDLKKGFIEEVLKSNKSALKYYRDALKSVKVKLCYDMINYLTSNDIYNMVREGKIYIQNPESFFIPSKSKKIGIFIPMLYSKSTVHMNSNSSIISTVNGIMSIVGIYNKVNPHNKTRFTFQYINLPNYTDVYANTLSCFKQFDNSNTLEKAPVKKILLEKLRFLRGE